MRVRETLSVHAYRVQRGAALLFYIPCKTLMYYFLVERGRGVDSERHSMAVGSVVHVCA